MDFKEIKPVHQMAQQQNKKKKCLINLPFKFSHPYPFLNISALDKNYCTFQDDYT